MKTVNGKSVILIFVMAIMLDVELNNYAAIDEEIKGCYNYFMFTTNYMNGSAGYGLTADRMTQKNMSSIAATGFLLGSYPVFVEQGLMSKEDAQTRAFKTIETLLNIQNDPTVSYGGCLAHFVNSSTGKRFENSEISTIDTAIMVSGAITAGEYFQGEVQTKAMILWSNVDFSKFITTKPNSSKEYISMGIRNLNNLTQLCPWDYYAEQLMIYILGAGNPNPSHRISSQFYKNIAKVKGIYGGYTHIYSWFGSLFTYQFSQAFFNFKKFNDPNGINYFENSVNASHTAYQYCVDNKDQFKTYSETSWGLTACDTPLGYNGYLGALPRGYVINSMEYNKLAGTIAPCGAISSMPFTPKESYNALKYYQSLKDLNNPNFGLKDAFNLDFEGSAWYDNDFIGIDKGIEVLQLYNYKNTDFISNLAMKNQYIIEGFLNNGFFQSK